MKGCSNKYPTSKNSYNKRFEIEQAYNKLQNKDGKTIRIYTTTGGLIIEISANLYRKAELVIRNEKKNNI